MKIRFLYFFVFIHISGLLPETVSARGCRYEAEVFQDDPFCFYEFKENEFSESLVVRNSSRAKYHGPDGFCSTTLKLVPESGCFGENAVSFGRNSYIEIPHHPIFDTQEITVEFWVCSNQPWDQSYWPGSASLVSKCTSGPGSSDWVILGGSLRNGANEGRILIGIGPSGGDDLILASRTGLNDGMFHHVVWTRTRDGQNMLFVDGEENAGGKDLGGTVNNNRPIHLGGDQFELGGTFLNGRMASVAIYPRALTKDRIQVHFREGNIDSRLPPSATVKVDFVRDIKPIFQTHCFECHGTGKEQGGLSLSVKHRAFDGGDNGRTILPGKSGQSTLLKRIAGFDEDMIMPPKGERLNAEQVGLIRAWIDQGADWPSSADEIDPRIARSIDHWSFKSLQRPVLPKHKEMIEEQWDKNPVDTFVLARLRQNQLEPTPPASKSILLRRVSFDLTGLPPEPEQILAFENDTRPDAYERMVEQLLASPGYGERWARHWLDVVRYADTGGYETDIYYEQAWRYRDYVIRSFNEDKPYDQFLMEQVAGDELWPEKEDALQDAVALWTLGQWPNALDKFPEMLEYARRTDQVTVFGEVMLGITIGCANCHHHKYDPITQRDYFGLEAIFAASETWDRNTNKKSWSSGERNHFRIFRHASSPTEIRLLARGELTKPRGVISPALPAFLPEGGPLPDGSVDRLKRRAHLARWLVSRENPLTARVMVNRVWQWHFGQAIVLTPNDFGIQGSMPSHPELLDWLASELVENHWSLKHLHRMLVRSSTYRQSSVRSTHALNVDPQNIWLSGFSRRRLEAEEVWDHLHVAAGTMVHKLFGSPFVPKLSAEELKGIYDIDNMPEKKWPVTHEQNCRAIYLLNRRSFRFPFFEAFDPPNTGASCPLRQSTTVPAQALTLLNNTRVNRLAESMSHRLRQETNEDSDQIVRLAWLLVYSREPSLDELDFSRDFLSRSDAVNRLRGIVDPRAVSLTDFCLGLMNTSEFIDAH